MATPYSIENEKHTKEAHILALKEIYTDFYSGCRFECQDVSNVKISNLNLDGTFGVDSILKLFWEPHKPPLKIWWQERFRTPDDYKYRQLTLTEWNHETNKPSEIYKIRAGYILYGYYDADKKYFLEVCIVEIPELLRAIARKQITYEIGMNPRSNQTFVCISIDELEKKNFIKWHYFWDAPGQLTKIVNQVWDKL